MTQMRVAGIELAKVDDYAKAIFEAQRKRWGAPLFTQLVHARRPTIFRAGQAMWKGIEASGLIPPVLRALVNRRVASHNKCVF